MNMTEMSALKVRMIPFRPGNNAELPSFQVSALPPRSRLYGLVPCRLGTTYQESLTSYLNRLGWRHHVSPRDLVAQEVVSSLSHEYPKLQLAAFSRGPGMQINGTGSVAQEWASLLERLTMRPDLHVLALDCWIGDLSSRGHLRKVPTWCPTCYTEWAEQALPLYQPMLWMLQIVTICPRHKRELEDCCQHCQKTQSVIARKTHPGHCTQCNAWLGATSDGIASLSLDPEVIHWQEWVIHALDELRLATGTFSWKQFFASLEHCMKNRGGCSKLAELTGFSRDVFYIWLGRKQTRYSQTPSLETILEFCYACNVTPLQVISSTDALLDAIWDETLPRYRRPGRFTRKRVDRELCQERLQAVVDGRETLLGVRQLAKLLGYHSSLLWYYFPEECALIAQRTEEQEKQRRKEHEARVCEEVRQAVLMLHAQNIFPSHRKVRDLLSDPNLIRMPEAAATWHAVRRERGLEQ
jgi:DNA-binding phage protein